MYLKIVGNNYNNIQYGIGYFKASDFEANDGPKGIHFAEPEFIHNYLDRGSYYCEVTVPENAKMIKIKKGHYKADSIIIKSKYPISPHIFKIGARSEYFLKSAISRGDLDLALFVIKKHNLTIKYEDVEKMKDIEMIYYLVKYMNNSAIDLALKRVMRFGIEEVADIILYIKNPMPAALKYAAENEWIYMMNHIFYNITPSNFDLNFSMVGAASHGKVESLRLLINHGGDPNYTMGLPLRAAAMNGQKDAIEYLKPLTKKKYHEIASKQAAKYGFSEIAIYFFIKK